MSVGERRVVFVFVCVSVCALVVIVACCVCPPVYRVAVGPRIFICACASLLVSACLLLVVVPPCSCLLCVSVCPWLWL